MRVATRPHAAFYRTGRRADSGLDPIDGLDLRPALLASYRDLVSLRYDFPLVLTGAGSDQASFEPLSGVLDRVLSEAAQGEAGDRISAHVLRLERQIRALVADGGRGSLSELWDRAARVLGADHDSALLDSLSRARAALTVDGDVVDCDGVLPSRLVRHVWRGTEERKARRLREEIRGRILGLSDVLKTDFVRSAAGRSAEHLRASIGPSYEAAFDFDAMSRLLATDPPATALAESRRRRIRSLISVLESYAFDESGYVFDRASAALEAFRARLPQRTEVARALGLADLEIQGGPGESRRDLVARALEADDLHWDRRDFALFPDYLVTLDGARLDPAEQAALMEMLAAGLPVKALVQVDDILDETPLGGGHLDVGLRSRQLAHMAMGSNDVFVLHAAASHLVQRRDQVLKGLAYEGPALFLVFSGAGGSAGDLPPYLTAAAAVESRAFPTLTYDPSAGPDWASRCDLAANPQVDRDWPLLPLSYEDAAHQRISEELAFTVVDFVALDRRYAKHFARVPRAAWSGLAPVGDVLSEESTDGSDRAPAVLMVGRDNVLERVIVDEALVRAARRCRETWHSLQELGGVHNSHAARLLERERRSRAASAPAPEPAAAAQHEPASAGPQAAPAEPRPEAASREAYIETPRCTTCNECIQINGRMFAYNENKQAYVANPDAGTYAELVEAAESCQMSIIHPGEPRNPNEPGLEELRKRAEPFR